MTESKTSPDWKDGFLFVGNALALDFLNTHPVLNGAKGTVVVGMVDPETGARRSVETPMVLGFAEAY